VQLREGDLPTQELHHLALELRKITRDAGAKLIINQRADVALAVEADGVHLGWRSLSIKDVRELCPFGPEASGSRDGKKLLVGISCHDAMQLHSAEEARADYALLGPVFPTPSKEGRVAPIGLETFRTLASGAKIPIIAIGGITAQNAGQARQAGAAGVAAISAIVAAQDPRVAARSLLG
jgi:thiamine-phosphate pyrophosphorylase